MRLLVSVACVAMGMACLSAKADTAQDAQAIMRMVRPYCAHAYGDAAAKQKCEGVQAAAVMTLAAIRMERGSGIDSKIKDCLVGQFPEPGSGVNFIDAIACVKARIPD